MEILDAVGDMEFPFHRGHLSRVSFIQVGIRNRLLAHLPDNSIGWSVGSGPQSLWASSHIISVALEEPSTESMAAILRGVDVMCAEWKLEWSRKITEVSRYLKLHLVLSCDHLSRTSSLHSST